MFIILIMKLLWQRILIEHIKGITAYKCFFFIRNLTSVKCGFLNPLKQVDHFTEEIVKYNEM